MQPTPAQLAEIAGRPPAEIEELDLSGRGVSDASELACCHGLHKLSLDNNVLESLEGIEELHELQTISAQHNQLRALDGLRGLPKLAVLNVSYNRIGTLGTVLRPCRNLKALIASDNALKRLDLHLLKQLEQLTTVVASRNQITEVAGAEKLAQLRKLSLSHNALRTVPALPPTLVELRLNDNRIASLPSSLSACARLTMVDLGGNQLRTFEQLEPLRELERLRNLTLRANPLCDGGHDAYQERVRRLLPRVRVLDSSKIAALGGRSGEPANRKIRFDEESKPQGDEDPAVPGAAARAVRKPAAPERPGGAASRARGAESSRAPTADALQPKSGTRKRERREEAAREQDAGAPSADKSSVAVAPPAEPQPQAIKSGKLRKASKRARDGGVAASTPAPDPEHAQQVAPPLATDDPQSTSGIVSVEILRERPHDDAARKRSAMTAGDETSAFAQLLPPAIGDGGFASW